ncbi:DegT/DnrJ/EryC1/StrS family aminotransferase [Rhodococcus sp. SJ-2]
MSDGDARYERPSSGHNSRLREVQADILGHKLTRLDHYTAGRNAVARRHEGLLSDLEQSGGFRLPGTSPNNTHPATPSSRPCAKSTSNRTSATRGRCTPSGFRHLGYHEGDLRAPPRPRRRSQCFPPAPALRLPAAVQVPGKVRWAQ